MSRSRTLALGITALVFLTGQAAATGSRISSMGGGVKNVTVLDDRNIFVLPSELVKYGTWAAIEIGTEGGWNDRQSFTATYQCDPEGAVYGLHGMSGNRPAIDAPIIFQGMDAFANEGDEDTHRGTFLYGRPLGDLDLGLSLSWWGDRDNHEDGDGETLQEQGPSIIQIKPGVGIDALGGEIDIALGLTFASANDTYMNDDEGTDNSSTKIDLTVRGIYDEKKDDSLIIPYVGLGILSGESLSNDDAEPDVEGSALMVKFGSDVRINVGDSFVQPGIGIKYESWTRDVTDGMGMPALDYTEEGSMFKPFFSLAADIQVTDWLHLYLGGYHAFSLDGSEGTGDGVSMEGEWLGADVDNRISSGLGFNLADGLRIDSQLNMDSLRDGGYVLSGEEKDFTLQTSVIYSF